MSTPLAEPIPMEIEKDDGDDKKQNNDDKKKPRKKREINSWDIKVTKKDFTQEIDTAIEKADALAKTEPKRCGCDIATVGKSNQGGARLACVLQSCLAYYNTVFRRSNRWF